jgi:hypothetical protein
MLKTALQYVSVSVNAKHHAVQSTEYASQVQRVACPGE